MKIHRCVHHFVVVVAVCYAISISTTHQIFIESSPHDGKQISDAFMCFRHSEQKALNC